MSFVSLEFIIFVLISLILYYILPAKMRWIALLAVSYAFYIMGGGKTVVYLVFTTLTTYLSGIIISSLNIKLNKLKENQIKKEEKEKLQAKIKLRKRLMVAFAAISNFSLLFFFKYWNFTAEAINGVIDAERLPVFNLILPLGISFYMFQSIGYVIDVYRNKYKAEKNILKFALFVSFFPQVIQGPISRFDSLGKQLTSPNKFSYDNMKIGIQIALWGYLKKLVIADRAAVVVNAAFNNYANYDGGVILIGVILYCIQLYCDFSGGIDITRGVAKMFGIDLIENFKRPIFATSLADFWRRWHISLGTWMKDYLFYPLSLSKPFIKLGKIIRNRIGGKAGKIIPVSIVTFIVYFAIGIWHGASWKYIVFGIWNGVIITISLLLEPVFINIKTKLKINDKNSIYKLFQIIRTSIIVLIGRYITRAGRFLVGIEMLKKTVLNFSFEGIKSGTLLEMGITTQDYIVIIIGTVILLVAEAFDEKGDNLRLKLDKKSFKLQWLVMMLSLITLLVFGICRGDYIASEFIYKQF
ncbi:MAG: MBOAT family protein [Clostridia bacterium]|nr:MBOAT family protein [Clostridia bacterium]